MRYPLDKVYITQKFGENPSIYRQFGMAGHNGVDFRVRFSDSLTGERPCYAAFSGEVIEAADQGNGGYGKFVRLQHGKNAQTVYGHFSKILVSKGDKVIAGQKIGITGNTGFSSGAHLHFGFRPEGWESIYDNGFKGYVDPLPYLEGKLSVNFDGVDTEFTKKWAGWLIVVPELHGETWYINPKTLKRYLLAGGVKSNNAAILARDGAWIGMSVADLNRIPKA